MSEIEVDPDDVRDRAAALQALGEAVRSVHPVVRTPDCGDPLAQAAVTALVDAVRCSLPAVAVELTTVSTIVARAASLYENVDDGVVARD